MTLAPLPLVTWLLSTAAVVAAFLLFRRKPLATLLLVAGLFGMAAQLWWSGLTFVRSGPWVTVENSSGQPVHRLQIAFDSISCSIDVLEPGGRSESLVYPDTGAPVSLSFENPAGVHHTARAVLDEPLLFGTFLVVFGADGIPEWKKGAHAQ